MVSAQDEVELGKKLQLARKRAGLTQQELCQKASLSYSTLAKIERGAIRSPSVFTVASIAAATGISLEELLGLERKYTSPPAPNSAKKRSKTGVTFVYFDVNGTIVRFFERAFAKIAARTGKPIEMVETLFWRYDQPACAGKMTTAEANKLFDAELGTKDFDWQKYYLAAAEATPGAADMLKWAAENYEIGLLTNNWPGFTQALIDKKLIPNIDFTTVVESSKVGCAKPDPKIYDIAREMAGVRADEILLVDDNPAYIRAADAAGWHALRFDGFDPKASIDHVKSALEF